MELSEPVLAGTRQSEIAAKRGGKTGTVDDPFFANLNSELSDKGFCVLGARIPTPLIVSVRGTPFPGRGSRPVSRNPSRPRSASKVRPGYSVAPRRSRGPVS